MNTKVFFKCLTEFYFRDANKRLQDTNDTLRDVIDVTAKSLSPNPMKKNSNNYKRGSVIGDYIKDVPLKNSSR